MVEGAGSSDYRLVKTMLYARPDLMHRAAGDQRRRRRAVPECADRGRRAGGDVFDSWGGVLADGAFQQFQPRLHAACAGAGSSRARRPAHPRIVFTKGGGLWLEQMASIGADVLGLDWTIDLGAARRRVDDAVALQGNLDPSVLFAPPPQIEAEVRRVLESFGPLRRADGRCGGHVFNLGHGISQHAPPDHVAALVDAVHAHSRRMRATA
jgi:uroporphyrinogen decarboxylase